MFYCRFFLCVCEHDKTTQKRATNLLRVSREISTRLPQLHVCAEQSAPELLTML